MVNTLYLRTFAVLSLFCLALTAPFPESVGAIKRTECQKGKPVYKATKRHGYWGKAYIISSAGCTNGPTSDTECTVAPQNQTEVSIIGAGLSADLSM